jgi:hypothetical protein
MDRSQLDTWGRGYPVPQPSLIPNSTGSVSSRSNGRRGGVRQLIVANSNPPSIAEFLRNCTRCIARASGSSMAQKE